VLLTGEADPEGNEVGLDEETITDLLAANADDMIARSDAKIEELRESDQGGPYVIRCIGHEGIEHVQGNPERSTNHIGKFLEMYDPEFQGGHGMVSWSHSIIRAKQYPTKVEAWADWSAIPASRPIRDDGKPNRPLTSFSIEVLPTSDFTEILYIHLPEDGDHRRRSLRDLN